MLVRRPLRSKKLAPASRSRPPAPARPGLGVAPALLLSLALCACAGDGSPRPTLASEPRVEDAGPGATMTTPPSCGSAPEAPCGTEPTPADTPEQTAARIDTASAREPMPYGWRLHRAPRRSGYPAAGVSWRTAGDLAVVAPEKTAMVMSAAPVPASFHPVEPDPASLDGLLPAAPAPAGPAQAIARLSPSAPEGAIAVPLPSEVSPSVTPPTTSAAPAEAALVAYAAVATPNPPLTTTMAAAPSATTPAEGEGEGAGEADATLDRPEWIINVATHATAEDARRHVEQLIAAGFKKAAARQETVRGRASYRVVIERLPTEAAVQSALADLSARHGIGSAWAMRKR